MTRATLLRAFESHVAEIGGIRTRYWVGGDGPPLVLVHGLAGAAYNFTELAPFLARRHRVLIPDLPGHGGRARCPSSRAWVTLRLTSSASPSTRT